MIVFLREKFIAQLFMWVVGIVFAVGTLLLLDIPGARNPFERDQSDVVLKINNTKVGREQFERLVTNELRSRQQQNQSGLPIDRREIEQSVIDQLVQQQIWLSNTQISNAEIERYIRSDSSLLTNYNLSHRFGSGDSYRESVRLYMSSQALRDGVEGLELVTDTEIEHEYLRRNDKAKFKFIQFQNHEYNSAVTVDDTEAREYFDKNKEAYKVEDQINLKYIKIDPRNFVTDEAVEAYYNRTKQQYTTPEIVKARHILKKFPDNADDAQKAQTKTEAEELLKTVNEQTAAGTDFAELAEKHSEDTGSAPNGGALRGRHPKLPPTGDYFARGDMVAPFEKAAFEDLKPGEISGLIETQFGYHIIKLEEKKPESVQPFDQVKREVQEKFIQIEGVDKAKTIAEELLFDVEIHDYEDATKLDAYKGLNITVQETGLFAQGETNIPTIGSKWTYRGLDEKVFNIVVGVSEVIETKKFNGDIEAYFVGKVLEKKAGDQPNFDAVKDKAIDDLKKERTKQMAFEDAQKLLNLREPDESLEDLAKKYKAPEGVSKTERTAQENSLFTLTTSGNVSGMGSSREAMFAAFNMELNEVAGPFQGDTASYIVRLVEREEADAAKLAEDADEKTRIRRSLLQTKKSEAYSNWFAALKKHTPKWVHPDYQ